MVRSAKYPISANGQNEKLSRLRHLSVFTRNVNVLDVGRAARGYSDAPVTVNYPQYILTAVNNVAQCRLSAEYEGMTRRVGSGGSLTPTCMDLGCR